MKPKTLILMLVAIGCGLLAAFVVSNLSGKQSDQEVQLVVTKDQLKQGDLIPEIVETKFTTQGFRKDSVPMNAIKVDPAEPEKWKEIVKNKVVVRTLDKGSLCSPKDFSDGKSFVYECPKDHLAIAVPIKKDSGGGAGFIVPGVHVDAIGNFTSTTRKNEKYAKIFLQNLLVLAVETKTDVLDGGDKKIDNPTNVTLAVTPAQAEILTFALNQGPIGLAMRMSGNKDKVETSGASAANLEDRKESEGPKFVGIPVAKKNIPAGTKIKENVEDFFELRNLPVSTVPKGSVSKLEFLKFQTIKQFVPEGQTCTVSQLSGTGGAPIETDEKIHIMVAEEGGKPARIVQFVQRGGIWFEKPITGSTAGSSVTPAPPVPPGPPPMDTPRLRRPEPDPEGEGTEGKD